MSTAQVRPKLRWPLDLQRFEAQGQSYVALRDEDGVAPDPAVFPSALLPLIACFDGRRTLQEIQQDMAPYGVTQELLTQLVRELESMSFLETDATRRRWDEIRSEYLSAAIRQAAHAGRVYPADGGTLRTQLDEFIERSRNGRRIEEPSPIVSLICPHIDYARGWQTYGASYAALERMERPDVIFLIGTCHQASELCFHLTRKTFATPLGLVPAEQQIVDRIVSSYGAERCLRDEILHRREHSLELQLPFLLRRFTAERMPPIVPILVGSFHRFFYEQRSPIEDAEIADFVGILAEVIKDLTASGKRVLFYGGVDLAHVGTHFGDQQRVSDDGLPEIERRDRELMDAVLSGDEQRLFEHMAEDSDRRRICGYPSMYTMLAAMRHADWRLQGRCIEYRQAVDRASDCIVTFASAYWCKV